MQHAYKSHNNGTYLEVSAAAASHKQRIAGEDARQIVQQVRHATLQHKRETYYR